MEFSSREMIIQAKEDLKILEIHHPNRFEYLKLELKSFISFLESQQLLLPYCWDNSIFLPTSSQQLISTQASTCEKNQKGTNGSFDIQEMEEEREGSRHEFEEHQVELKMNNKNRVDLVLEKAQSCLKKIQELKASLC